MALSYVLGYGDILNLLAQGIPHLRQDQPTQTLLNRREFGTLTTKTFTKPARLEVSRTNSSVRLVQQGSIQADRLVPVMLNHCGFSKYLREQQRQQSGTRDMKNVSSTH